MFSLVRYVLLVLVGSLCFTHFDWFVVFFLQTVAESLRYESSLLKLVFDFLSSHFSETLYHNYTMKELIWGYHDPMMSAAMKIAPDWWVHSS